MRKGLYGLIISLMLILGLVNLVYGAATAPSKPEIISVVGNTTVNYNQVGEMLNRTRGFIWNLTINNSQTSQKWVAYVGNINGEYALQDAAGNALYDWDIVTVTGELYATKEGAKLADPNYDNTTANGGGIPVWENLTCASTALIEKESELFNHSPYDDDSDFNLTKYSSLVEEDSYLRTWSNATITSFYAGETLVSGPCYHIHLNQNNGDQTTDWEQIVLTDGTFQRRDAGPIVRHYDIIYAALLENNTAGFNGELYDFQMLLPQTGLEGEQPNTAYYFYVELI